MQTEPEIGIILKFQDQKIDAENEKLAIPVGGTTLDQFFLTHPTGASTGRYWQKTPRSPKPPKNQSGRNNDKNQVANSPQKESRKSEKQQNQNCNKKLAGAGTPQLASE